MWLPKATNIFFFFSLFSPPRQIGYNDWQDSVSRDAELSIAATLCARTFFPWFVLFLLPVFASAIFPRFTAVLFFISL